MLYNTGYDNDYSTVYQLNITQTPSRAQDEEANNQHETANYSSNQIFQQIKQSNAGRIMGQKQKRRRQKEQQD